MKEPSIHLAFRFHVNFYHSYRGDTPDEQGFGQDIRIIRHIIAQLDDFNAAGIPVRGTWDIENLFSLEEIIPRYSPDILAAWQRRVLEGHDEIEVMSHNNGLLSAHTAREFDLAISRALSNAQGSGLRDLFSAVYPMVRPQEMMYTPAHLKLYRQHGLSSISLFYSAVPFNAFSTFLPPLPLVHAYNPLTLTYPGIDETLTLVPARNHGDIPDNLSLRRWVKRLHRQQLKLEEPTDLLLLIDADADDTYWAGYDWPGVKQLFAMARGLEGLVSSVADLDFVTFTTPGAYLADHPPVAEITVGQDTADGAFDGYASWADKWSNHQIWTGIERARILELQARRLVALRAQGAAPDVEADLEASLEARLRALSTTHFGLAAPVMNRDRLRIAADLVAEAVTRAAAAFAAASAGVSPPAVPETAYAVPFTLIDYARGVSTDAVTYRPKPSRALVRLTMELGADMPALVVTDDAGQRFCAALAAPPNADAQGQGKRDGGAVDVLFVTEMPAGGRRDFVLRPPGTATAMPIEPPVCLSDDGRELSTDRLTLTLDDAYHPVGLTVDGAEFAARPFVRSAVRYDGKVRAVTRWRLLTRELLGAGSVARVTVSGEILMGRRSIQPCTVYREYLVASALPYLYITTHIRYPQTPDHAPDTALVARLKRAYDDHWQEVMPCELRPALVGQAAQPLRVWKHNYLDRVSCYDLDYGAFSRNEELDSVNNHITHAWVAVTDRKKGLLVAQTADATASFAFCPLRTRRVTAADSDGAGYHVRLNPFGSYWGDQLRYPTAYTGLGRAAALQMAETLRPFAPSYNGQEETLRLMIAPYLGDAPPAELQQDAEAFAYPYIVLSSSPKVPAPPHRAWSLET